MSEFKDYLNKEVARRVTARGKYDIIDSPTALRLCNSYSLIFKKNGLHITKKLKKALKLMRIKL